jgi:ectoine hydroxylase-related dioxygenase (phytanoyl-CoA dioxygenase family)
METGEHLLQIELSGYTVLHDLLTASECGEAIAGLDRVFAEELERGGPPHGEHGGWAYNLMNKARIFERVYQAPRLMEVIHHFLGDDAVLSGVMARLVLPGAPAQGLHYDGSLTGPFLGSAPADQGRRDVSLVFGLNVIWCLTPFSGVNGATRLVPGSHRLPTRQVAPGSPPGEIAVEAPAGSALVFNIATWHGSGAHTGTEPRYSLITPWRRSWVRPEVDLSRMVRADVLERAGPDGKKIFGITSRPAYVERWQWDSSEGRPREEWRHAEDAQSKE